CNCPQNRRAGLELPNKYADPLVFAALISRRPDGLSPGPQRVLPSVSLARSLRIRPLLRSEFGRSRVRQRTLAMFKSLHAVASRPAPRRWLAATAGLAMGLAAALPAKAEDTIKVGVLHSLSGTMAISETTLKDVVLMLIDEQNKKGGLL